MGSFPANGYGLFDVSGNAWEWCSDWYGRNYYAASRRENPTGPPMGDLDENGLQKRPTDLNAYLTTQLGLHSLVAQEKGIALALALPPDALQVSLHPEKFGRVLDNLLNNALKFTPTGGTITVGVRQYEGKVRLTVQDTGIGIPGKLHNNLFDKFNPTRRAGLQGEITTGLGLFIAKQIVELHGGHIWLESREREGTTFFIELT